MRQEGWKLTKLKGIFSKQDHHNKTSSIDRKKVGPAVVRKLKSVRQPCFVFIFLETYILSTAQRTWHIPALFSNRRHRQNLHLLQLKLNFSDCMRGSGYGSRVDVVVVENGKAALKQLQEGGQCLRQEDLITFSCREKRKATREGMGWW